MASEKCHLTPGFIQEFCNHSSTRYGLCQICGAITTPGALKHIDENYRAGDCPWCAHAEPDEIFNGSPVDWHCKIQKESCQFVRMYSLNEDCKKYFPRRVVKEKSYPFGHYAGTFEIKPEF